jgi:electron transfer flavoprotein beta subunit
VSSATGFAVDGGVVTISRRLEDCIEVIATDLPAVVCVLPEINKPPIPGLKAVLDAGKKPVREFRLEDLGLSEADLAPKTELKDFSAYVMNRKNVIMDADSAAAKVKELVANLKREGVV